MPRREFDTRDAPRYEQFAISMNDAFAVDFTIGLTHVTTQSMDVRKYRRLGFFYQISATAGGPIDLTYTLQASWGPNGPAQGAWYDVQGMGNVTSEGPKVETAVIGRRAIWWEINYPIVRVKITGTGVAGERARLNSVRLWGRS